MAEHHRRLKWDRRARLHKVMPPVRCSSRSKRTGLQCKKWAQVGAFVCGTHGARAPQVREAANRRIAIAEALLYSEIRPPGDVLEESAHIADVLMRQARRELELGSFTVAKFDRLIQALERANRLAKVSLDAGIDQRRMRLAEGQANQMHKFVTRVVAGLELTLEQKRMLPELMRREVRGILELEGDKALVG